MAAVALVHPFRTSTVPAVLLTDKCDLFQRNPCLLQSSYSIRSPVPVSAFAEFISALKTDTAEITPANVGALSLLCEEMGFHSLSAQLWEFRGCGGLSTVTRALRAVRCFPMDDQFTFVINGEAIATTISDAVALSPAVAEQLQVDACARTFVVNDPEICDSAASWLGSLRSRTDSVSRTEAPSLGLLFGGLCNTDVEVALLSESNSGCDLVSMLSVDALDALLSAGGLAIDSEDSLLAGILERGEAFFPLLRHVRWDFLSPLSFGLLRDKVSGPALESSWSGLITVLQRIPSVLRFDSLIVRDVPEILAEFNGKGFSLLWRGSRDGFRAASFHAKCDGHPNTLTLVLDTNGNVFGGFTPCMWDPTPGEKISSDEIWRYKCDNSQQSFLFTLKNPHGFPPKIFPLKSDCSWAIGCHSHFGPCFGLWGTGHRFDITIPDNCHVKTVCNSENFGSSYTNDTGHSGMTFFTGAKNCRVKEIEVFQIIDVVPVID